MKNFVCSQIVVSKKASKTLTIIIYLKNQQNAVLYFAIKQIFLFNMGVYFISWIVYNN